MSRLLLSLLLLIVLPVWAGTHPMDAYHNDNRATLKLHFPQEGAVSNLAVRDLAEDFLRRHRAAYGLPADLGNLQLDHISHSLLGSHYHYRQMLNGLPVYQAEIIVSISYENRVTKVYNNTWPVSGTIAPQPVILAEEDAYDIAWDDLKVRGPLTAAPTVQLVYLPKGPKFRLVYQTLLVVEEPQGSWRSTIDAVDGRLLNVESTALPRKPMADTRVPYDGPIDDRVTSFAAFAQRQAEQTEGGDRATGSGMTFDPDPRTTLLNDDLRDNSPAAMFNGAYFTRDLLDITNDGGTWRLNGPWCAIQDFSAPATPPSTTPDGNWTATRGNNAFNDSMTYFHIDQSQRYMQSLGFTGATGIQEVSIGTDTDALNGADNSQYQGGPNRLLFGHGCVDDNEDADVILHEYGHAINHSINNNWGGGDTGAMGEGWGDYWAGSYSYSTPNGPAYHPEWVYTWDGQLACWTGRDLNRTDAMYDPSLTYGAHQTIGGFESDELWSAPIFMSLIDLVDAGEDREDADQITLEAQFGLGGGLTMRNMAGSIVAAARDLFPAGPHADIYVARFQAQNMLEAPLSFAGATLDDSVHSCDDDGFLDAGETGLLTVMLKNTGLVELSATSATITSSDDITFENGGVLNFPNSTFEETVQASIEVTLNSAVGVAELNFEVVYDDTNPSVVETSANTSFTGNQNLVPNQRVTDDAEQGPGFWSTLVDLGNVEWDIVTGVPAPANHAWFAVDAPSSTDSSLVTPMIPVNAAGNFTFSFDHRHSFETGSWDGGVLEISTNGTDWTDIGAMATPGYNGTITTNEANPISDRPAFVNNSPNYPNMTTVNVNLGTAFQGQNVWIRFRLGCDGAEGAEGWFVDNLSFPTLAQPLFPMQEAETEVCQTCFATPGDALDALYTRLGDGDWPGNASVDDFIIMLNNICEPE